jgi:hypothetical protein
MIRTVILFVCTFLLIQITDSHAQILNKLKRAAEDGVKSAVERRVAHEMEKAMEKQTDKYMEQIFGPPTQYEGTGYDYGKMIESLNMDVETAEMYSFTGYTDMEISGTNENGKEIDPAMFRTFMNSEQEAWGIELESDEKDVEKSMMIFDNKHEATIMLMENKEGEKSRLAYGMDWSKMMEEAAEDNMEEIAGEFNITKTGNSKSILGYECDEYISETDTYAATYWVSQESVNGYTSYWSKNNFLFSQQMKNKYSSYFNQLPDGDVLEMNYVSKEDNSITNMEIKEINNSDKFEFVMADYVNALEAREE